MANPRLRLPSRNALEQTALFLAFVTSTVAFATTTVSSRAFVEPVRAGSAALFVIILFVLIAERPRINKSAVISAAFLILLFTLGMLNMVIQDTVVGDPQFMMLNFFLTIALSFVISLRSGNEDDRFLAVAIVGYAFVVLLITIAAGGVRFYPVPQFLMEFTSQKIGKDYIITYSQGVTKFYGLAAIAASYLVVNTVSPTRRLLSLAFLLMFIILTFLGAARGDTVAVMLVVLFVLRKGKTWVKGVFLMILIVSVSYLLTQFDISQFELVKRFTSFDSAVSVRGELLANAFNLLALRPDCLLVGCGFDYFQSFYGLPANMYPHNIFVEYLIVFGGVVTIASIILASYGLYLSWKRNIRMGLLSPILALFFLVGAKSGTVVTSWFPLAGLAVFVGIAISNKKRPRSAIKNTPVSVE